MLMAQFKQQVEQIENDVGHEKARQTQLMKDKLEEKKQKRAMQMMKDMTQKVATSDGIDAAATAVASVGAKLLGSSAGDGSSMVMSIAEQLREALVKEMGGMQQDSQQSAVKNIVDSLSALLGVSVDSLPQGLLASQSMEENVSAMREEQERLRKGMKERHENERKMLERDLETEERRQEEELKRIIEEKKIRLRQEKDARLQAQVASDRLSKDEADKLLKSQQSEMEEMEAQIETEKNRQSAAMKAKLAERKQRRLAEQVKKQEVEFIKETSAKQHENAEMQTRILKEKEQAILEHLTETMGSDKLPDVVEIVLQQRHARELQEQATQQLLERQLKLQEFNALMESEQNREHANLLMEHEKQIKDLLAREDVSPDLDAKRADLEDSHEKEIWALNEKHRLVMAENKSRMLQQLELAQSKERFSLRKQQIKEYQEMMASLGVKLESSLKGMDEQDKAVDVTVAVDSIKQRREEAEREMQELERLRVEHEKEKLRRVAEMEAEKQKHEAEKQKMKQEEMRKYEQQLEAERKKEEEKMAETLKKRREEILRETRQRQEKELQLSMSLSEDQKAALMERHKHEYDSLVSSLDVERDRQSNMLADRIARKKEARKKLKGKEIESKAVESLKPAVATTAVDERPGKPLTKKGMERPGSAVTKPGLKPGQASMAGFVLPDKLGPETCTILLDRFGQIEQLLLRALQDLGLDVSDISTPDLSTDPNAPFQEELDKALQSTGGLAPLDPTHLRPAHFVAYKYGLYLVELFVTRLQHEPLTLLVAKSLPGNVYHRNAFRNSYYYSAPEHTLFIRQHRFDSVGSLALVLSHAMAHIKVRDFVDDSSAPFLREFYRGISLIGEELFHTTASHRTHQSTGVKMPKDAKGLEALFAGAQSLKQKQEIADALIQPTSDLDFKASSASNTSAGADAQAPSLSQGHFAPEKLKMRMEKYQLLIKEQGLREYLARPDLGSIVGQPNGQVVANRIAEIGPTAWGFGLADAVTVPSPSDFEPKPGQGIEPASDPLQQYQEQIDSLQQTYLENTKRHSALSLKLRKKEQELRSEVQLLEGFVEGTEKRKQQQDIVRNLAQEFRKLRDELEATKMKASATNQELIRIKDVVRQLSESSQS
eukprot:TRINITY_DN4033_c0_g1_i1.p1 TRINITY_DN4033_c0_g1~~TRINITY_DN4033_c0_g1_i1.p1  ORF type:complete len:1119 (-),score=321.19 TRINITY_DN4033_c0_g1_i1:170-3526(-)